MVRAKEEPIRNAPIEKAESVSNASDKTAATSSDWNAGGSVGSEAAESAIFTDYNSSDSASRNLPPKKQEKPLKSALKKPKVVTSQKKLSDDEATVISATSLDRGQLQQVF